MNIGVVFGSRSPEHDVSITSAYAVMKAISMHTSHTPIPVYITKEWQRVIDTALTDIKKFKSLSVTDGQLLPSFSRDGNGIFVGKKWILWWTKQKIDCFWNICHGENWEDGVVSWLARLLQIPMISVWHLAEAISIDKDMMKKVFQSLDLPLVPYMTLHKDGIDLQKIESTLQYPLFVKPVSLWSSIWVSRCENIQELEAAIELAAHYDERVMIEQAVENLQELNCCVLEKNWEILTTEVEEPSTNQSFLTFEEKYTSETWWTMKWTKWKVKVPAEIPDEVTQLVKEYTKTIYRWLMMKWGAPRVDFLYDNKNNNLYVNEVNVTPWSMQMPLRKQSWWTIWDFIETLAQTAISYHNNSKKNIDFSSNILDYTIDYLDQHEIS